MTSKLTVSFATRDFLLFHTTTRGPGSVPAVRPDLLGVLGLRRDGPSGATGSVCWGGGWRGDRVREVVIW